MEETITDFYNYILQLESPWEALKIIRNDNHEEVTIEVSIQTIAIPGGKTSWH